MMKGPWKITSEGVRKEVWRIKAKQIKSCVLSITTKYQWTLNMNQKIPKWLHIPYNLKLL